MWGKLANIILLILMLTAILLHTTLIAVAQMPREETLMFARGRTTIRWNEYSGSFSPQNILYLPLFLEGESYGRRGFVPVVARGFEWVDAYTVRVYIRSEAVWSDGRSITADDVITTIRLGLFAKRGPGSGCTSEVLEGMRKIDDKTVEFKMNRTSYERGAIGYIQFVGCWITLRVYPKHIFEAINASGQITTWRNTDITKMVTSGPYKVISIDEAAGYIYFERIDTWWGRVVFGLPRPKYLIVWMAEDTPRVTAIRRGDTDWDGNGGMQDIYNYFKEGVYTWDVTKPPYYRLGNGNYMPFNMRSKVVGILGDQYDDARRAVRLAMLYAFPWDDHIDKALQKAGVKSSMAWIPDEPPFNKYINRTLCKITWGNEECVLSTDLTKAKQILDQAGVIDRNGDGIRELPDGTPLKITYLVRSGAAVREIVAQLFIENLKSLGFDIDYRVMALSSIQSLIQSGAGWDIVDTSETITINWATPWSTYYDRLHSLQIPFSNYAWYKNTEMEKWIGLLGSPFEEERLYAASKVQELLYRDIPYIVYSRSGGGAWYQIRYDRWIGWPNASNPWWWPVASFSDASYPLLFGLASRVKGERPVVPWWTKPIEQGGLLIPVETLWDQISQILRPRPTPTIVPTTVSTTTSVTTHVTTPKPTLTTIPTTTPETTTIISLTTAPETTRIMQTVTYTLRSIAEKLVTQTSVFTQTLITREVNWVITIILAIILLAVGSAIGYIIKK